MLITNNMNLRQNNNINRLSDNLVNSSAQIPPVSSQNIDILESSQSILENMNVDEELGNINKLSDNPIDRPVPISQTNFDEFFKNVNDIDLTNCTLSEANRKMWYLYMNDQLSMDQLLTAQMALGKLMDSMGLRTSEESDVRVNFIEAIESTRSTLENITMLDTNGEYLDSIKLLEEVLQLLGKGTEEILDKETEEMLKSTVHETEVEYS